MILQEDFTRSRQPLKSGAIGNSKGKINSSLFERLALSKDKKGVLQLSEKGHIISYATEAVKDPYVLDFLKIPQSLRMTEKDLEQKIIDNLQMFLLELGKGFAFVARQYKISLRNKHFYIDLVFYHRILKCFVLIDLKLGKLSHQDIGQMDLYVRWFEDNLRASTDNPTIGIILCSEKNETIVKYSILKESKQLFTSKYKLYLPTEKEFKKELETEILQFKLKNNI